MATATVTTAPRKRPDRVARLALRGSIAAAAIITSAWVAGVGSWTTDGRAAVSAARGLLERGARPADPAVQDLAAAALRRDSTMPAAIELIAVGAENRGDQAAAARLYNLSNRVSRRSLATRLWFVQAAVDQGDAGRALAQMDLALRTSLAAPKIVFPALARGLEDPALVAPIAKLVDRSSEWREAFLVYAAQSAEPRPAASLFTALRNKRIVADDELDRVLIARLAESGDFIAARQVDRAFASTAADPALLADGDFRNPAARYPFGWGLTDEVELAASREVEGRRAVLAYHVKPSESGQLAAQLLTLPPGGYRLETRALVRDGAQVPPLWVVSCAGQRRPLAILPLATTEPARPSGRFVVTADCPAQWLTLLARATFGPQSGIVESVRVAPLESP